MIFNGVNTNNRVPDVMDGGSVDGLSLGAGSGRRGRTSREWERNVDRGMSAGVRVKSMGDRIAIGEAVWERNAYLENRGHVGTCRPGNCQAISDEQEQETAFSCMLGLLSELSPLSDPGQAVI